MRFSILTLVTTLAATGCVIHVDPDYDPAPSQIENHATTVGGPITQVVADIDAGSLTIQGALRYDAFVDADLFYDWDSEPRFDVYTVADTLYIELDCPGFGECRGDIYVQVPFDALLDTNLDVGDLAVHDTMGDWIGSVGAGTITGSQLTGFWADVLVDTGTIDLAFDLEPDAVSAYARVGDLDLTVPAGAYDVTTVASSGSVSMRGVIDDPLSIREINATTSTGDIFIYGF